MGPDRLVLVAGTGTDVGKTWVSCRLAVALRASGLRVAARKPVQSFGPGTPAERTDAGLLAAATGERAEAVCPPHRWYPRAMAPPMAADALGLGPIPVEDLAGELAWPVPLDVGLVESVGGTRSPLAHDADTVGLARLLDPSVVVIVAPAGLGCVHAVRAAGDPLPPGPVVVHLNRHDPADEVHRRSLDWLATVDGLVVTTTIEALAGAVAGGA